MTDTVFVDTSFFKALIDIRDDFHLRAVDIWMEIIKNKTALITTNFILDETFTLIRVRNGLAAVLEFRDRLAEGLGRAKLVRVTVQDEADAWDWFINEWKDLSFTDCVSFAVMKRLGIVSAATFDRHFSRAGFAALSAGENRD